jgi:adenylyl cyclase-associated protein
MPPAGSIAAGAPKPAAAPAAAPAAPAAGAMAALFAEISRGGAVTAGLRKVAPEEKSKNRPPGASSGRVPAAAAKPSASAPSVGAASAAAAAPPRLECEQGRKWVVERWTAATAPAPLEIAAASAAQSVYVFGCAGVTVVIKGKVNAVTLDGCVKTALVHEGVVAAVEVVNCRGVEVQVRAGGGGAWVGRDRSRHIDF